MPYAGTLLIGLVSLYLIGLYLRKLSHRRAHWERLFREMEPAPDEDAEANQGTVARWLFLAGFRSPRATALFFTWTALGVGLGLTMPLLYLSSGLGRIMAQGLTVIPGAIGDIFLPFVYLAPWIVALMLACLPWMIVRKARRDRVKQMEQDLPLFLELFATLSEAGLGFDAALDRLLRTQPAHRALANEFRTFQLEVLAGRRRIDCLRRIGRRADVLTLTMFVSAMAQAEQAGGGIASVLRRQADDLRERRQETLLAQAMSLPVKLVFPLVICFLPGIFTVTLGPIFHQFFQIVEGMIHSRGGM